MLLVCLSPRLLDRFPLPPSLFHPSSLILHPLYFSRPRVVTFVQYRQVNGIVIFGFPFEIDCLQFVECWHKCCSFFPIPKSTPDALPDQPKMTFDRFTILND